jgi:hypothetical protein
MSYHRSLGADIAAPPVTLEMLAQQHAEIIQRQKDDESRRKWTLLIGAAGALFAAVKLGIVAFPHIRAARQRKIGELGSGDQ